jgi:phosphatidylserine/phosphatidylglycerophosphate/cardiolipin synthase-like enzyme
MVRWFDSGTKRVWTVLAVAALLAGCAPVERQPVAPKPAARPAANTQCSVYFSPNGGCTDAICDALGRARKTVFVQAYSFTSTPVARALLDAKKRGVDVRVILDKSQTSERYSSADFLANSGIPTKIDRAHAIAHNKVMIIDDQTVITGSFNFTKAAEQRNAENLLIIRDAKLAASYTANWEAHEAHSETYQGRVEGGQ